MVMVLEPAMGRTLCRFCSSGSGQFQHVLGETCKVYDIDTLNLSLRKLLQSPAEVSQTRTAANIQLPCRRIEFCSDGEETSLQQMLHKLPAS